MQMFEFTAEHFGAAAVMPYPGNVRCEGSTIFPTPADCDAAVKNIADATMYSDQAEFSVNTCYVKYATNGAGPQPVPGSSIKSTINTIRTLCPGGVGSDGTDNCVQCHVTVNHNRGAIKVDSLLDSGLEIASVMPQNMHIINAASFDKEDSSR